MRFTTLPLPTIFLIVIIEFDRKLNFALNVVTPFVLVAVVVILVFYTYHEILIFTFNIQVLMQRNQDGSGCSYLFIGPSYYKSRIKGIFYKSFTVTVIFESFTRYYYYKLPIPTRIWLSNSQFATPNIVNTFSSENMLNLLSYYYNKMWQLLEQWSRSNVKLIFDLCELQFIMNFFFVYRISEENFWRNYFYRVSLICQANELSFMSREGDSQSATETYTSDQLIGK